MMLVLRVRMPAFRRNKVSRLHVDLGYGIARLAISIAPQNDISPYARFCERGMSCSLVGRTHVALREMQVSHGQICAFDEDGEIAS